ncbi:hypothetical protein KC867_00140 [Candidatus Saccharibacteria bacterium]|nr:hypothetical protein [Candidatus Saccharibacteria bacterium]
MLNNTNNLLSQLYRLGLSADEGKVYLALLKESMSHLEVARKTGVNRTKVYRIADELEKRGLIAENQNDTGRRLVANNPMNLEIAIKTEEVKLDVKKSALHETIPVLQTIYGQKSILGSSDFEVNTYEGVDGMKQMLWNELRTKDEILIFANGTLQDLVGSQRWAEKHRQKTLDAGYIIREIVNPKGKPNQFTKNIAFVEQSYNRRFLDKEVIPISQQLCIYNDTVSIYNWQAGKKVGAEIVSKYFADMQRAIFEDYWQMAAIRD